jgi:hypothetical protein
MIGKVVGVDILGMINVPPSVAHVNKEVVVVKGVTTLVLAL